MASVTNSIRKIEYTKFSNMEMSRILDLRENTIQQRIKNQPLGGLLLLTLNQFFLSKIQNNNQTGEFNGDQIGGINPPPANQILPKTLNCYQWAALKSNLPAKACQQLLFTAYKTSTILLEAMKKWGLVKVNNPKKNDLVFYYNHQGRLAHMGLSLGNGSVMAKTESGTNEVLLHPIDWPIIDGSYSSYEAYHRDEKREPVFDGSTIPQIVYEGGQWKILMGEARKVQESKSDSNNSF